MMVMRGNRALFEQASRLSAATLCEAFGKRGSLPSAIKPLLPEFTVCGPAFTVSSPPKDNLWLHHAIYEAKPGDVLVVYVGGYYEAGYWGDIMTQAAMARKISGLVIDGCVRDYGMICRSRFPVFSRGLCINGTSKDPDAAGGLGNPVLIGNVRIETGDLIFGDADGVVSVPAGDMPEVLVRARERDEQEQKIMDEIAGGRSTLDIYRLPRIKR